MTRAATVVFHGITSVGEMRWYRHDGWMDGTARWTPEGGKEVESGFPMYSTVFGGSQGTFYCISPQGWMFWNRHDGWMDGTDRWATGSGNAVGSGWNMYSTVFGGGQGVIYGITPAGEMRWYRHDGWKDGTNRWATGNGGNRVGSGWNMYSTVFGGGQGVIYGITPAGEMRWYRHDGWKDGTNRWATGNGGNRVGSGWNMYSTVFGGGQGVIYGITPAGEMRWYRHDGWKDGTNRWTAGNGGNRVGSGWNMYSTVFVNTDLDIATPGVASQRLILMRPADMLLMEIGWSGCTQAGDHLTVDGEAATLSIRFPPQSLAEAKVRPGTETAVRAARQAGTSRLEVGLHLPTGTQIPLTTEGILRALSSGSVVGGAVEAPFGLVLNLGTATDNLGGGLRLLHAVGALAEQGVTSVWQLPLANPYAPPTAAGVPGADPPGAASLTVDDVELGSDEGWVQESDGVAADFRPLNTVDRGQITDSGPVSVEELRLSALGASFTAHQMRQGEGGQQSFRWDHRTSLGRDIKVRVQRTGLMWPFGNAAVFQETAERVVTDGVAGLQLTTELRITEAVRAFPDDDSVAARAFPFSEVEILTRSVTGLADTWQSFALPPSSLHPLIDDLQQQLRDAQARLDTMVTSGSEKEAEVALIAARMAVAELQKRIKALSTPLPQMFVPSLGGDAGVTPDPVLFQVRCAGARGDVCLALPLVFVNDLVVTDNSVETYRVLDDPCLAKHAQDALASAHVTLEAPVPGSRIDLVRAPAPKPTDVQTVTALRLDGRHENRGFHPALTGFDVELTDLRTLLPDLPVRTSAAYSSSFRAGESTDAVIELDPSVPADFGPRAERGGGLIVPTFTADVVSRTYGPADQHALPGAADVLTAFKDMRLLGIPLSTVLLPHVEPPQIVRLPADGRPPGVRMSWDLGLHSAGILVAHEAPREPRRADNTTVSLTAEVTPDGIATRCAMSPFMLAVPGDAPVLELAFSAPPRESTALVFEQKHGAIPDLTLGVFGVTLTGQLSLLKELESAVDFGSAAPTLDVTPQALTAGYGLTMPDLPHVGPFALRDVAVRAGVAIPFRGGSPAVDISFSSREDPFQLTVLAFGGGGYLQLTVDGSGLKRLEASLDFGASIGVDFGIVQAEVHAVGGVSYVMEAGQVRVTGFIRLGGSVDVLGLVSVSIDLRVELTYHSEGNRNYLSGRATLVIDIDLTLYSDSVQLDSGEWVLAGDGAQMPAVSPGEAGRSEWKQYQEAYA